MIAKKQKLYHLLFRLYPRKLTFSFGKCKICSDAATGIHYGNLNYLIDNENLLYLSDLIKEYQLVKDVK